MICSILDVFEQTVCEYPDKIAFQDVALELSFQDLEKEAMAIGCAIAKQAHSRRPVIIFMEKGVKCISAFLGSVYAGCFYVPIDKDMPYERLQMIFECLKPNILICDKKTYSAASTFGKNILVLPYDQAVETPMDRDLLAKIRYQIKSTDLLYVLFTSGSTGMPKGVTISHNAVLDFSEWICDKYGLDEHTSLCNQAPFYFDASVPDIFIPIKTGASTFIPPKSYYTFPKKVLGWIDRFSINTLIWVPSALCNVVNCHAFDTCIPQTVKLVIFCGEVMPCKYLNEWRKHIPDALYVNMYGPTEATYACTYYNIENEFSDDDKLPLGKPCENCEIILLNEDGKIAERDELGEICILGQCLSQGYYHDVERTKEVFVQNPTNPYWMETMYRTGDLAYRNSTGDIIFAGRKDSQIKRLGYRIELGEIENAICSVSEIERGCCLFNEATEQIFAFYSGELSEDRLRSLLQEKLPQYMIPNRFIRLDSVPMNLNGKIDRVKLKREYAGQ